MLDRERVHGRREIPVDEQKADHGRGEGGPHATDGRDHDDEQQEQQEDAGEPQIGAQVREDPREERQADGPEHEAEDHAPPRQCAGAARPRDRGVRAVLGPADHVDVEADAGVADHPVDHRAAGELREAGPARRAEDDLRCVERARRRHERLTDVCADDLAVGPTDLLHELTLAIEAGGGPTGEPVLRPHVNGKQVALRPRCHPRCPPHEAFTVGGARQRDDDALPRLPRPVDAVPLPVVEERIVDAVGDPEQGELPERAQVPRPEVVPERGVNPLSGIDVAVCHPAADGLGSHVDELDLVRTPHHRVGDGLLLLDPGDLLDDVVDRLEMLDVECRDHRDPRVEEALHVFPALLVPRARHVGVGQLVDEGDLRPAGDDRVDVHLLEGGAPVVDVRPRHHLETGELCGSLGPAVRLDEADDDVRATFGAPATLSEHRVRLPHPWSGAEVDAKRSPCHGSPCHG